jgi:hypothetical protein
MILVELTIRNEIASAFPARPALLGYCPGLLRPAEQSPRRQAGHPQVAVVLKTVRQKLSFSHCFGFGPTHGRRSDPFTKNSAFLTVLALDHKHGRCSEPFTKNSAFLTVLALDHRHRRCSDQSPKNSAFLTVLARTTAVGAVSGPASQYSHERCAVAPMPPIIDAGPPVFG